MRVRLGTVVVVLATLLLLPTAARAATLYTNLNQPYTATGANSEYTDNTRQIAQAFTATASGTGRTVSFFAQGVGTTPPVQVSIRNNNGGTPGSVIASGQVNVPSQTGSSPSCVALNTGVPIVSGGTYFVSMKAINSGIGGEVDWQFRSDTFKEVFKSTDGGSTWPTKALNQKTFSLRVEDSAACGPEISPNPLAGTTIADMITKPGGKTWATVALSNVGNADLTLTGGSITGTNAGSFQLLNQEPGGPNPGPYAFPKIVGADSTAPSLYVVCTGSSPDGYKTATLTVTSDDADEGSIAWPLKCLVDSTPPTVEYTYNNDGSNGWYKTSPATVTANGKDPESNDFVVRVFCTDSSGGSFDAKTSSLQRQYSAQGTTTLACRATDIAGNTSPANFIGTVKIDTVNPDGSISSGPAAITKSTAASFSFAGSDATSGISGFACKLDSGAFSSCTSPSTRSSLADGVHTFQVQAFDFAGNNDSTPASYSWRVDTVEPDTSIGGGPDNPTKATNASFTVAGTDTNGSGVEKVECKLDAAANYTTCPSPVDYAGLAEGSHTLSARATDKAGNVDSTPASKTWAIDLTAPTAQIDSGPTGSTASSSASFTFSATNAGPAANSGFQCRVDSAAFAACSSPASLSNLTTGDHVFQVRAVDVLGNVQATPTSRAWTVIAGPNAAPDSVTTTGSTPVDVNVLANDTDPGGGTLSIGSFDATSAHGGTVVLVAGKLRYTRAAGFTGTDTFTYRANSTTGGVSSPATVTVTVNADPVVTATPTATATATATASPDPSATATATASPDPSATATASPDPSATATATASPDPSATATATVSPDPTATATGTAEATATATATETAVTTATPTPTPSGETPGGTDPLNPGPAMPDTAAPVISGLKLKGRKLKLTLSEPATATIKLKQRKRKGRTLTRSLPAGANSIKLGKAVRKGKVTVRVWASDAAGNQAKDPVVLKGSISR